MQCESVLRSVLERVKTPHLTLSVVWRATGPHLNGYSLLREMYEPKGVHFFQQSGSISFFRHVLPRLWVPRNLYHWLKHDYVRKADNFKPLLEQVIAETPADFVSFNTDDNIYYRDELLPEAVFKRIREKPYDASYRVYVGGNLSYCPKTLRRDGDLLSWDYLDPVLRDHWAYPFSVDGTFYARSALLDVIHRVLYHNPVTLESYLVSYVKSQRLLREGFSPLCSSMVGLSLNKVSFIAAQNRRGNLSVESLNNLFLDGYRLEHELPDPLTDSSFVPRQVFPVRGGQRVTLPVGRDPQGM